MTEWTPWKMFKEVLPQLGEYVQVESRCTACSSTQRNEGIVTMVDAHDIRLMGRAQDELCLPRAQRWRSRKPPEHSVVSRRRQTVDA